MLWPRKLIDIAASEKLPPLPVFQIPISFTYPEEVEEEEEEESPLTTNYNKAKDKQREVGATAFLPDFFLPLLLWIHTKVLTSDQIISSQVTKKERKKERKKPTL